MSSDAMLLALLGGVVGTMAFTQFYSSLSIFEAFLLIIVIAAIVLTTAMYFWEYKTKFGREKQERLKEIRQVPHSLLVANQDGVKMGIDENLFIPIFLPDHIRRRHVHIIGATGSGKTESVILNFLKQDVDRGIGCIILDAKGDASFLSTLRKWIPEDKLRVFDLGSESSLSYDPLAAGTSFEAAQRLFSSLNWSEEYYKSKALSALQKLFQRHYESNARNPRLIELSNYLEDPDSYKAIACSDTYPDKLAERDFMELSGLRDQIKTLCIGYLENILSPKTGSDMKLDEASEGRVLYFRLQSLISPQLVATLGKLLINHINFLAGSAHRVEGASKEAKLVPIYLDEFASFACPEFADLISKARSAGLALHFSHQSIGDLMEVSEGFLSRITDNSGTKIVLRINDPDSAEYFARTFGTKLYQKVTQRITNVKEIHTAETVGEGTQREAHQFRSSPDLFKTLPTGVGSVLVAHGNRTAHGASHVFRIRFPKLEKPELTNVKIISNNHKLPEPEVVL